MTNSKTRISKQPDERRQEMLDTAMRVFTQKGYEQTKMRDIANEMQVVPGLCYRYFDSKQALYQAAMKQYATDCAEAFTKILDSSGTNLKSLHNIIAEHFSKTADSEKYHSFFHRPENKDFRIIMNHMVCELVVPHMAELLGRLSDAGEISVSDPMSYAQFLLFGLVGIFDDDSKPFQERMKIADELLSKLYHKEEE